MSSLYIAADSRITWGPTEQWDHGAKTFASPTTPDVLGYCGDALVPALVLPQFIACLGAGLIGDRWRHRRRALKLLVERTIPTVPRTQRRKFEVVYCAREGSGMRASFCIGLLTYRPGAGVAWREKPPPSRSRIIHLGGSGGEYVERQREAWNASETQGRTSRAEYAAFVDALLEGEDPDSGGPPQLVGLYRIGNGRHFGTSYKGKQFVQGAEVTPQIDGAIEWRNELFERVDGPKQDLLAGAQPHERPGATAAEGSS